MKKGLIVVTLIGLIGAAVLIFIAPGDDSPMPTVTLEPESEKSQEPYVTATTPGERSGETHDSGEQSQPDSADTMPKATDIEMVARQKRADVLRREIDVMMSEFDAKRFDRDFRREIQQGIKAKMAEYNETVLPLALRQMEESAARVRADRDR